MSQFQINDEDGSLDRFTKKLNRARDQGSSLRPTRLSRRAFKAKNDWSEDEANLSESSPSRRGGKNWLLRFFFWSLAFFLATVLVAIYVLFFSTNVVSSNNIDLEIKGPTLLRSGDELNLELNVRNRNRVTLRDVSLAITYPPGTTDSFSTDQELSLVRETLADLGVGQVATVVSRAIVFGAQNSNQTVQVVLEYQIPDSNAIFTKEISYEFQIGSAPLELSLVMPSEINSGKLFTAKLKLVSNAQTLLRQVAVKVDYPDGFNWQSADPEPAKENDFWFLGDLSPGATREISFNGTLTGQNEEIKSFKITAGLDRSNSDQEIEVEYGSLFKTINLKKDFVEAVIDLGGLRSATPGQTLSGWINWRNNLDDRVINNTLRLYLSGPTIDKRSVKASAGFYDSVTNSIYWDKNSVAELGLFNPGATGRTGFSLALLPLGDWPQGVSTEVRLRLVLEGVRITAEDAGENIVTETEQTIKLGTSVQLNSLAEYSVGPFKNTGPLPPQVGQETTYTVTWSLANSTNELKSATVTAILPPYVRWLSIVSPLDEKVIYHNTDQTVTWDLGVVSPDLELGRSGRQVSFQISLLPSLGQVGQSVNLTGPTIFNGLDGVTGQNFNLNQPSVTTNLSGDPSFRFGQGEVVE